MNYELNSSVIDEINLRLKNKKRKTMEEELSHSGPEAVLPSIETTEEQKE